MSTLDRYRLTKLDTDPGNIPPEGTGARRKDVHRQAQIRIGAVPDPNPTEPTRGKRQRVAINVKHDILENEYSAGRITPAEYVSMRQYGDILERCAGKPTGGGQWLEGSRIDPVLAVQLRIIRGIDNAKEAEKVANDVQRVFGARGGQIVRAALLEPVTLESLAARFCGATNRNCVSYVAITFRQCASDLAAHWAARGRSEGRSSVSSWRA